MSVEIEPNELEEAQAEVREAFLVALEKKRRIASRKEPFLDPEAFHGGCADVIETLREYTEANDASILAVLLSQAGWAFGPGPHVALGGVRHSPLIWPMLCGPTANGRKGSAQTAAETILRPVGNLPALGGETLWDRRESGLSTPEGLLSTIRDGKEECREASCGHVDLVDGKVTDPLEHDAGHADKRMLHVESEMALFLSRSNRGNGLTQLLRQAWDCPDSLGTTTRANPMKSSRPHVVINAHVTPEELRSKADKSDLAGGTFNRFLMVWAHRERLVTSLRPVPEDEVERLSSWIRDAVRKVRGSIESPDWDSELGYRSFEVPLNLPAQIYWTRLYGQQSVDSLDEDSEEFSVRAALSRTSSQIMRVALIFALLGQQEEIDVPHLHAAEAFIRYCTESVRYVFGTLDGDPDYEKLRGFLDSANPLAPEEGWVTKTQISVECFRRHLPAKKVDALIAALMDTGDYEREKIASTGRPIVKLRRLWTKK